MLPSMPILFTRDSQDAFGNKIEPSTSFFGQPNVPITIIKPPPPTPTESMPPPPSRAAPKDIKGKGSGKKKEPIQEELPKQYENTQANVIATSYFTRVQSKFSSTRVPNNKFVQFKDILKSFDPTKENPAELYKKIQILFGEDHKELADEFILFLTAGQAAEIGRLMDQFTLLQLNDFIELLQATFARKPTMLRKILRAINNSLNCTTIEEMKGKVLPHLRSSPRLAAAYRALFPDERPPESEYDDETEKLHDNFLTGDNGYDVWTFDDKTDTDQRRRNNEKDGLDTVYLHGRVFLQHGRNLRPARVSYPFSKEPYRGHARRLAPAHSRPSPPVSDDESRKKTQPKRTRKPKIKQVKDVNDNTKTDKKKSNAKRKEKTEKIKKKKEEKVKLVKEVEKKTKSGENWTRDEDKTMLQMLKGETVSDQVFGRINEKLPHRSVGEIKNRFFHVMTLLQQMAEVT